MISEQAYRNGRFSVPPRFDFKILPLKSRKVTVIAVIGECLTLLGENYVRLMGSSHEENMTSEPLGSYIDGYYECEKQIIYLFLKPFGLDALLNALACVTESTTDVWAGIEKTYLKLLFYLFVVSHFIVVMSVNTRLNPKYIKIFKVIEKMRLKLRSLLETYLHTLPLPRDWLASGRASVPRLLFVFKLLPSFARKISLNPASVRNLEQSLVTQLFNTFYETGLINATPGNQLFILPGHNFVHVILGNEYPSGRGEKPIIHDDLSQEYLDFILTNVNASQQDTGTKQKNLVHESFRLHEPCAPKSSPWDYPPPDQPEEHTFKAFLHLHVATMLDQATNRTVGFGQAPVTHELPSCKAWFMACYKLYTSLMTDDPVGLTAVSDPALSKLDSQPRAPVSLAQAWHRAFHSVLAAPSAVASSTVRTSSSMPGHEDQAAQSHSALAFPNDSFLRLSELRCRSALSAAEAHYKHELPIHYSNTYHLVKVVSAFNVFLSLARGPSVFRTLEQLSQRLAHLYLAGRVTCSAISLTGHACQHEMHRLPDEAGALRSILATADRHSLEEDNGRMFYDPRYGSRHPGFRRNHGIDPKFPLNEWIPAGLFGKWRAYWIESTLEQSTSDVQDSVETTKPDDSSKNPSEPRERGETNASQTAIDLNGTDATDEQKTMLRQTSLETKQHLAVMPHRSDFVLVRACSCGRQQAECPDPFDYIEANWRFYATLAGVCCNKLASIPLAPQFLTEPGHPFCLPDELGDTANKTNTTVTAAANSDARPETAGAVTEPVAVLTRRMARLETAPLNETADGDKLSGTMLDTSGLSQPPENQLLMLSAADLAQDLQAEMNELADVGFVEAMKDLSLPETASASSETDSTSSSRRRPSPRASDDSDEDGALAGHRRGSARKPNSFSREPSPATAASSEHSLPAAYAIRFRDGVPASHWQLGDIPRFPSWSIHALGKYFSYSHSSGLSCRGFLRNSNFLLPWDVTIGPGVWGPNERGSARGGGKSGRGKYRSGRGDSDTVKLFIGFEMECPLGHRFFLAGPDRAMDGPMQSSQVRRAVQGLLTRDLPLFMPCRCQRSGSVGANMHRDSSVVASRADGTEWHTATSNTTTGSVTGTNNRTIWAQLTRIYLAIPAAPIRVRFQPRVRPGPPKLTPVFHLGPTLEQQRQQSPSDSELDNEEDEIDQDDDTEDPSETEHDDDELLLDNGRLAYRKPQSKSSRNKPQLTRQKPGFVLLDNGLLWVVRLPFAYHDGNQLFTRPTSPDQINKWRLLKGCIKLQF